MTENLKPISTRDATKRLYWVLRIMGIDNLNQTWPYIIYGVQLNFTTIILQVASTTISYVLTMDQMSMGTFLTSFQVAFNVYAIIFKIAVMFLSMERLRKTGPILDKLDAKIHSKEERAMAEEMVKNGNRLVLIFIASYFTYSGSTTIAALLNGHTPYDMYIPYVNWRNSTFELFFATLIEYYLIGWSCMQDVGLDAYALVFIYICRMHLKILCLRLEALGRDPTKSHEDNIESLKDCVDTHRTILDVIETIRPIVSKTVFIQFVVTAAMMGLSLINIMMYANLGSAIGSIFFFLAISVQTLPLCYTMNVLMEEINSLPNSIFHSNWMGQNRVFRQLTIFFIQNTQKFQNIIAGDILPIQCSTFLSIAKLGFSIYALVNKREQRLAARRLAAE